MHTLWGWQGGTGWHEIGTPRATPCFIGFAARPGRRQRSIAAAQQGACPAASRALPCKSPHSRAFARSDAQTGGGNAHERVPPPCFVDDRASPGPESGRRGPVQGGFDAGGCGPPPRSPSRPARELPIKQGVARDLSPVCHPVPPCHPERHALLDRRPGLRVMTGARTGGRGEVRGW